MKKASFNYSLDQPFDAIDDQLINTANIKTILLIFLSLFGILGNLIISIIFLRKRYRRDSSYIYMICLAVNDNLFLLIHLSEDFFQSFELFVDETINLVPILNIVNKSDLACRLVNYFRNVFRFNSSYLIVALIAQRFAVINKPFPAQAQKKTAFNIVLLIVFISLISNIWVLFLFQLYLDELNGDFCDIKNNLEVEYFQGNIVFISLSMLIPIAISLTLNSIIVYKKIENNRKKKKKFIPNLSSINENLTLKLSIVVKKYAVKAVTNRKISEGLSQFILLQSSLFILINIPYSIAWYIYFLKMESSLNKTKLFDVIQILEIIYVINFGLKFYLYSLFSCFRKFLKKY